MKTNIAIIGAGLMGRLIALSLTRQGYKPTLIDKDDANAHNSAAYAAAGLLTPLGEAVHCESNIVAMGFESLKLWPKLLAPIGGETFFQQEGAIMVSHGQDQGDYIHFARFIKQHYPQHQLKVLNRTQLESLEPELGRAFNQGLFLSEEGQINNRKLLIRLEQELKQSKVNWLTRVEVVDIKSDQHHSTICYKSLNSKSQKTELISRTFDLVIDCRGTGARDNPLKPTSEISAESPLADLRAVRGELFQLYAPEVKLLRPIRLMHPRYQLYIAPKGEGYFAVGATEIESDDMSPMTVRSSMELLSAAYSVHPGFAEASIHQQIAQCRPAFSNNQPKIIINHHTLHVNGLYRHGFLIAPVVLAQVESLLTWHFKNSSFIDSDYSHLKYSHLLPISVNRG